MALYKRNATWWVSFTHNGQRVQRSTGTDNQVAAREYHDKLKAQLWNIAKLEQKPVYSWRDAVLRWLHESRSKRSIETDRVTLRWLDKHLHNVQLHEMNRDLLETIADAKAAEGVTPTTVNRMLEIVRAILNRAHREWEWIDKVPVVRMHKIEKHRIRWLTVAEANRLLRELPAHLRDMAAFSLATGLRASNVRGLQWQNIDLMKCHAWIHPDQAKTKKAISVPLNEDALTVLKARLGTHPEYVFTYHEHPVKQCSTRAWVNALKRAGIENFRWHDLRHTWASWHVQNGTSLQELQQLGGWSCFEMVLRYAHLSGDHLRKAANRIEGLGVRIT